MGNVRVSSITRTPVDQGGGVWGGLGAGPAPPAFAAQKLYTSQDMVAQGIDGVNRELDWITNEAEPFARLTYNAGGVGGLIYLFQNPAETSFYCSFYQRRHSLTDNSKCFKVNGKEINSPTNFDKSNITITSGVSYTGSNLKAQSGDSQTGSNDNAFNYDMTGAKQGAAYTRAAPTIVYGAPAIFSPDTSGTVWEHYEYYSKRNSDGTPDGELGIRVNGVLQLQIGDMYNCADGFQEMNSLGLGEYAQVNTAPFFEDYKKVDIGYDRPSWMLP